MKGYTLSDDQRSITCLGCGMTSHNPIDAAMRYCGHCRKWIGEERCDFCDAMVPTVKDYRAKAQIKGLLEDGRFIEDKDDLWAACADCAVLADAGEWDEFIRRVRVGHEARYAPVNMVIPLGEWHDRVAFIYKAVFGDRFTWKAKKEEPHDRDDYGSTRGN